MEWWSTPWIITTRHPRYWRRTSERGAALRRYHGRRARAAVVYAAGAVRRRDAAGPGRGRRAAAGGQDGPGPGDGGARQGDGAGLHVLYRLRPGQPSGRLVGGDRGRAGVPG